MHIIKNILTISILILITTGFIIFKKVHKQIKKQKAIVTYYAHRYNGRKTALGTIYDENKMTCATTNKKYLGHNIQITNDCDTVIVYCNDLMATYYKKLRFDLTTKAFKLLNYNSLDKGVMTLDYEIYN